jgi:hypothetical protein
MPPSGPPTPDELQQQFPISPEEAQAIATAMTPLQDITGVGSSLGSAMEGLPGTGPAFAGTVLQTIAAQVNLTSQSAEAVARALQFYVQAQEESFEAAFPPPDVIAEQLQRTVEPLAEGVGQFPEDP